jgi:hypothetical protein
LIRVISLMLGGAHFMFSIPFHFILPFSLPFSLHYIVEAVMLPVALFRMWSASPANVPVDMIQSNPTVYNILANFRHGPFLRAS